MLDISLHVDTVEDAERGIQILTAVKPFLPNEIKWEDVPAEVKETSVPHATSPEPVVNPPVSSPTTETPQYDATEPVSLSRSLAQEAEHALLQETAAKKARGRPPGSGKKPTVIEPAVSQSTATASESAASEDSDLLDLLRADPVTIGSISEPEPEEVAGSEDDDMLALLGESPSGDEYDLMDHDALYGEVRDRMTRKSDKPAINGAWLSACIREAKQRDGKILNVTGFSDVMLRQLLRGTNAGTDPVDVFKKV